MQFPEGAVERPTDISINDDGVMAMLSLKGKCFLFNIQAGDKSQDWPTRGPRPMGGYGRGRGRGRGGGGRGGRGSGRGGRTGMARGSSRY